MQFSSEDLTLSKEGSNKNASKKSLYYQYTAASGASSDMATIYFTIRDKHEDLNMSRKDSILEFS
jgi:hypothetical protein